MESWFSKFNKVISLFCDLLKTNTNPLIFYWQLKRHVWYFTKWIESVLHSFCGSFLGSRLKHQPLPSICPKSLRMDRSMVIHFSPQPLSILNHSIPACPWVCSFCSLATLAASSGLAGFPSSSLAIILPWNGHYIGMVEIVNVWQD